MPPGPASETALPAEATGAPSPAVLPESAPLPSSAAELPSIRDALAALAAGQRVSGGDVGGDPSDAAATPAEPAREGVKADAAPEGAADDQQKPLSRREQERQKHEQEKTALEQRVSETEAQWQARLDEVEQQRQQAEARAEAVTQQVAQRVTSFTEAFLPDERYKALQDRKNDPYYRDPLDGEEEDAFQKARLLRENGGLLTLQARMQAGIGIGQELKAATARHPGLDPKVVDDADDYGRIIDHVWGVAAASRDAEIAAHKDTIAQQAAQIEGLKLRANGAAGSTPGRGVPSADGHGIDASKASGRDLIVAGLRQQAEAARNGRR